MLWKLTSPVKLPKPLKKNILPPPPKPDQGQCRIVEDIDKFDCYPEDGASPENCNLRGCCWSPTKTKYPRGNLTVPLNTPYCFYPANYPTYKFLNSSETAFGLVVFLKRNYRTAYPNDSEIIQMTVKYETQNRLHVKVNMNIIYFLLYRPS